VPREAKVPEERLGPLDHLVKRERLDPPGSRGTPVDLERKETKATLETMELPV